MKKKEREEKKRRKYSAEFKAEVLQRLLAGENATALSRTSGVPRRCMYDWLERYRKQGGQRLRGPGRPSFEESVEIIVTPAEAAARRIAELERKVGQQTLEVDFLRKAFKCVKESRQPSSGSGGTASTERSEP